MANYCPDCGKQAADDASFCTQCGRDLRTIPSARTANTPTRSIPETLERLCPNCNRPWGAGIACQYCSQLGEAPTGIQLSTVGRRFGAHLLEMLLVLVTLFFGWAVWSLIVWRNGQTPAKQLLGMRTVKLKTGTHTTWGTMLVREFVGKVIVMTFVGVFTVGLGAILQFMLLWDKNRQEPWDKLVETVVVNDPEQLL